MKRLLVAASMLAACNTYADSGNINSGASMTYGPSSNKYSLASASFNPAMNSLVLPKKETARMSYFPTFGFNVELGQVDNFADDLEELADIIDDPSSTDAEPSETLERFNNVLALAGEDGYMKFSGGIHLPLLPFYFTPKLFGGKFEGTFGVDFSINVQAGISLLDDELSYNNQNNSFSTASSIYLKSGIEKTLSVSYSRNVLVNTHGQLFAGVKFKYINMELSKQLISIIELADEDMQDIITDAYDQNQMSSSDFGLDFGLVWDAKKYRVGLILENINSPKFEYGEIGSRCEGVPDNTSARSNCEAARYFTDVKGEISAKEIHTKHALLRGDAIFDIAERIQISAAVDFAKYDDFIGRDNQWIHTALSYSGDSYILPSMRVGYHKNLAGSKTSSITAGLTLFKIVSLDFEYGLESVDVDGSSVPRRVGFSLSIEEQF